MLMTTAQVCQEFQIHRNTLSRYWRVWQLKRARIGNQYRYRSESVRQAVARWGQ